MNTQRKTTRTAVSISLILLLTVCFSLPDAAAQEPETTSTPSSTETIRLLPDREYFTVLLAHLWAAENKIDLAMYLFRETGTPGNKPARIADALITAAERGVAVRVLLEQSDYNDSLNLENRATAERLRQHGVTVLFDPPTITTHAKLAVIDHRYVFLGSHNFTQSALDRNREFSILIESPETAAEVEAWLDTLTLK